MGGGDKETLDFSNYTLISEESLRVPQRVEFGTFELVFHTVKHPFKETCNEDSLGFVFAGEKTLVAIVADGVGGSPKGEEASRTAVESVLEAVTSCESLSLDDLRNAVLNGLEKGNAKIMEQAVGSLTTATAIVLQGNTLRCFQVGDSGVLVFGQRGKLRYKSGQHSPVGYGVEAGLLDETEALSHPNLNEVANLVGEKSMTIEMGPAVETKERDTVLVCSDGLLDNFINDEIVELFRTGSLEETAYSIDQLLRERASKQDHTFKFDDCTFIAIRSL